MQSQYQKIKAIFDKWEGKKSDFDGNKSWQCVDWARQFASEIGNPIGTFGGSAINCWNTGCAFTGTKWKRVKYANNVPIAGDIVFFDKTSSNPYGHVAVVDGGCTTVLLDIVEQNGGMGKGKGEGTDAIRRKEGRYKGCLGWFTLN